MFSISYELEGNKINVTGVNPDQNSSVFNDTWEFDTEAQAKGFHMAIKLIETAISDSYKGKFAVGIMEDLIDITTESPLSEIQMKDISYKLDKTLELAPISEGYKFHNVG